MSAPGPDVAMPRPWTVRGRAFASGIVESVEAWPVPLVLAALIAIEWLAVIGLALDVHHNGWIYYQGGDQLWYYSLGWLLGHGHLWQTSIGYLWSFVLAPISLFAGPNVANAMPVIVVLNVAILLPAVMLAVYGIASRLAGRFFGYWALAAWIVVPFIGIEYTNTGYHMKYTEVLLPQGFGLTALADFPAMVLLIVALYFCARVILDESPSLVDGAAAGAAASAAIGLKPSIALMLLGPLLGFVAVRRFRELACFVLGFLPALAALAVWKERGLGSLPLFRGAPAPHPGGLAALQPVLALNLQKYFGQLSWHRLAVNIDLLREHFWSGHFAVWLPLAGMVAIGRRSRPLALLIGGAFLPYLIVKSAYVDASVEDTSVFRILIPSFPLFVLGIASLPFLVPRTRHLRTAWKPAFHRPAPRVRLGILGAFVLLTALVPIAATAAASRNRPPTAAMLTNTQMPIPVDVDLGLRATVQANGTVVLDWRQQHPAGGRVFYRLFREPATAGNGLTCPPLPGAEYCTLDTTTQVGVTAQGTDNDTPGRGTWVYRVGVAANWLNSPAYGDVYIASEPLVVRVP